MDGLGNLSLDSSATLQDRPPHEQPQLIRLACQACQRKKIKCDRHFPCGQCQRSNLQCVPSTRKPRARHAGKRAVDSELRSRIAKLESLVDSLSGDVNQPNGEDDDEPDGVPDEEQPDDAAAAAARAAAATPAMGKYIANPFWSSISFEVQGLRDALEQDDDEDEAELNSPTASSGSPSANNQSGDYDFLLCPPGSIYVMPGALQEPSRPEALQLYSMFLQNVAPLFKIFHIPSLRPMLQHNAPYLGRDASAPGNRALRASLWFAAAATMPQSLSIKTELVRRYRRCVHVLLAQSDILVTEDLATLQALVTYVMSVRVVETSRCAWTLAALVVRTARAMGVHEENPRLSIYESELRRRLWHYIRFIDVFTAFDRGTEPLIAPSSFNAQYPTNCNDDDFDENSTSLTPREREITDMTFMIMSSHTVTITVQLSMPDVTGKGDSWMQRLELAQNFGKQMQEKFFRYCDPSIPFHRLIRGVCDSMCEGQILRAVRPLQRHLSSVPPRVDTPYVLQIAMNALRASEFIHGDPELDRWKWMVWVQWHPLAVALAGLCSIRNTPLAESAWALVERAYERHSKHVADNRSGKLWRPIEKLYKKAIAFRDEGRRKSESVSPPNPPLQAVPAPLTTTNDMTFAPPSQLQFPPTTFPPSQPAHCMPTGAVPMDPLLTSPVDFSATDGITPFQAGDMGWLDWERIMDDLSSMDTSQVNMGDLQQPATVPDGVTWPCVLHQDFM